MFEMMMMLLEGHVAFGGNEFREGMIIASYLTYILSTFIPLVLFKD